MLNSSINQHNMQTRYKNAQQIMQSLWSKKGPLNTGIFPTWVGDSDCFWYVRDTVKGHEFRMVDAHRKTNEVAFNHHTLAVVLSEAVKQEVSPESLPFNEIEIEIEPRTVRFTAFEKRWQYDDEKSHCVEIPMPYGNGEVPSPDGKYLVFSKDYNLWLREIQSGEESQLTTDGEEYFAYGASGTAWGISMDCSLQVRWSPDSKRIFTVQKDTRQVKGLPVVQHVPTNGAIRPEVTSYKIAYPGDEFVETLRMLAINVQTGEKQEADYEQIPVTRNSWGFFSSNLGWWQKDSQLAYFIDVDRYYKYARVVEFDIYTGKTKILFEETSDSQINLMVNGDMHPSIVPLPESDELLWYSERTGWGHLYLYDLTTGQLKRAVTEGDWLVRDIVTVLPNKREVYLQRGCHQLNQNHYYRDLVRVNMDTGYMDILAESDHDYIAYAFTDMLGLMTKGLMRETNKCGTSPTGRYSVVTRTKVDVLPESLLLDHEGNEVMSLEVAIVQGMPEQWQLPEPVRLKAADGQTDIFGVVFRPSDFSPERKYPVINDIFNTPDFPWGAIGAYGNNSVFDGISFFNAASLAELGFIVVQIDGRGGSFRSKSFKDVGYGNLQLRCMQEDQVAGLKELAAKYPYMDISNVGLAGHLAGGPGIIQGLLDYPEVFKVGVSSFVHDSRLMPAVMWGDMFEGESRLGPSFPEDRIQNLKGKLLLLGGMLDTTNPPAGIFRIVESLQKANKDFDMLILPNFGHDYSPYLIRRSWDYFVEHLLDETPPKEFELSGLFGME